MNELVRLIMQLIRDGRKFMEGQLLRPRAIMLVGSTGSGKSTLLQYINGVQLEAFLDETGIYRLEVAAGAARLPEGMSIGHSRVSCTRYPTVYSPPGKDFSYIDTPGFGSTGFGDIKNKEQIPVQNIADTYFRTMILDMVNEFKIVLVVSHQDLVGKAQSFSNVLKDLGQFMQGIKNGNPKDFDKIKESVAIVVTKAPPHVTHENVTASLRGFINEAPALNTKEEQKMRMLLQHIVDNGQFAVFTAPNKLGYKSFDEAAKILGLIENEKKINFVSKQYAKIGVKFSSEDVVVVRKALDRSLGIVDVDLAIKVDADINKKMKAALNDGDYSQIKAIGNSCNKINGYNKFRLSDFIKVVLNNRQALGLSDATIKEYEEFEKAVTFLVNMLPLEDRNKYFEREWAKILRLHDKLQKYAEGARAVLDITTKEVQFKDGTLTLQGYRLKTSKITEEVKKYPEVLNVVAHGLHTIDFDKDLLMPSVNVSLVAPKVVIQGNKLIDLSGKTGREHHAKAINGKAGNHGEEVSNDQHGKEGHVGNKGADGAPGEPGGNSGSLSIFCAAMSNIEKLKIFLNGGNGANGQDGGDGGTGGNGSSVRKYTTHRGASGWVARPMPPNHWDANLFGGDGGRGGNGGRGGKGGYGGKAGQCCIIVGTSQTDMRTNLQVKDGEFGKNGAAGGQGKGGMPGRGAKCHWYSRHHGKKWYPDTDPGRTNFTYDKIQAKAGEVDTVVNDVNWQPAKLVAEQDLVLQLLDYKVLQGLEEAEHANIVGDFFRSFQDCYENASINLLETTVDNLLAEASALEKYRKTHGQCIDFSLLYYSLLARLEKFMPTVGKTSQERKVLSYLCAATLGNIASIKALNVNLLIIDIEKYVQTLSSELKDLADIKAVALKDRYKARYAEQIQDKITGAEKFLSILSEEVKTQQDAVGIQIQSLEAEIKAVIQGSKDQIRALEEAKRRLNKARKKKMMFGALNIATQAAGMLFPPFGTIVAPVVNAGLAMAAEPSFKKAINLAKSVRAMHPALKEFKQQKNLGQANGVPDLLSEFKLKQALDMAKMAQPIIKEARNLLKEDGRDAQNIEGLDAQIIGIDNYIKELEQFDTSKVKNYWQAAFDGVQNFQNALPDRSLASLEFSRLETKRYFDEIKQSISYMIGNFASSEGFHDIARKANEAIDVSINISRIIQEYREHMVFASYLADLQTDNAQRIDIRPKYKEQVEQLIINSQENIVSCEYYKAIGVFKQWVFPFAEKFLLNIPKLESRDYETIKDNLSKILYTVQKYKSIISKIDEAIHHRPFNTESKPPFFTWSYLNYQMTINRLLEGKKVLLNAYIDRSQFDAIKFKRINFEFQHPSKQPVLKKKAEQFQVTLKHSGISYYKYGEDVYQMSNDTPMEIKFSFSKDKDGKPLHYNGVFEKLWNGDILLSPYTSWTVWLEPTQKGRKTNLLQDLMQEGMTEEDKHDLNINLIGDGTYVDKIHGDTLHLYKFYRRANSYLMRDNFEQEFTSKEPWPKPCSKL